jgi:hypothetical protein
MSQDELLKKFNSDLVDYDLPNDLNCYKAELKKLKLLFEPELNLTIGTESGEGKNCTEAQNYVDKIEEDYRKITEQLYDGFKLKFKACDEFEVNIHTRMLQNYHLRALIIKYSNLSEEEGKKEKKTAMAILVDLAKERLFCFYGDLSGKKNK